MKDNITTFEQKKILWMDSWITMFRIVVMDVLILYSLVNKSPEPISKIPCVAKCCAVVDLLPWPDFTL